MYFSIVLLSKFCCILQSINLQWSGWGGTWSSTQTVQDALCWRTGSWTGSLQGLDSAVQSTPSATHSWSILTPHVLHLMLQAHLTTILKVTLKKSHYFTSSCMFSLLWKTFPACLPSKPPILPQDSAYTCLVLWEARPSTSSLLLCAITVSHTHF